MKPATQTALLVVFGLALLGLGAVAVYFLAKGADAPPPATSNGTFGSIGDGVDTIYSGIEDLISRFRRS